jgi:hypothetical protein
MAMTCGGFYPANWLSTAQRAELQRQATLLIAQQDRLLNLHLAGDISTN